MTKGNLLEIYYDRVIHSEEVVLTSSNCEQYGYLPTTITLDNVNYVVFYKQGTKETDIVMYNYNKEENTCITTIINDTYKRYTHIFGATA